MAIASQSVNVGFLYGAGALLVAILMFAVRAETRQRLMKRRLALVESTIIDHFRRSGVGVSVGCISLADDGRLTALIESEPMKRFRLSHIIEISLREHIAKAHNLVLDKIYWRFPVQQTLHSTTSAAAGEQLGKHGDDYINEGLVHYRDLPRIDVNELPWEKFEEMAIRESQATTTDAVLVDNANGRLQ